MGLNPLLNLRLDETCAPPLQTRFLFLNHSDRFSLALIGSYPSCAHHEDTPL